MTGMSDWWTPELRDWVRSEIADQHPRRTKEEIAEAAGVNPSTLRRWLDGANEPTSVGSLAYALGRQTGTELLERSGWSDERVARHAFIDDPPPSEIEELVARITALPPDQLRHVFNLSKRLLGG